MPALVKDVRHGGRRQPALRRGALDLRPDAHLRTHPRVRAALQVTAVLGDDSTKGVVNAFTLTAQLSLTLTGN